LAAVAVVLPVAVIVVITPLDMAAVESVRDIPALRYQVGKAAKQTPEGVAEPVEAQAAAQTRGLVAQEDQELF